MNGLEHRPADGPRAADAAARPSFLRRNWKALLGVAISAALLYLAFRDIPFDEVVVEIREADLLLLGVAVAVATSGFFFRALRWGPLLAPVRRTSLHGRFAATAIGFMANNVLPARVGEFARAISLSRLEKIPVTASFGSLVVERIFDGLTVVGFLFLAAALPGFPVRIGDVSPEISALVASLLVLLPATAALLVTLVFWPARVVTLFEATVGRILPGRLRHAVVVALDSFVGGLGSLRSPALLGRVAVWSLVHWLVGALSYWLAMRAFGIDLPFTAGLFLQSVVSLAVAIPSAPGFAGVYEVAFRVGLTEVWGVSAAKAVSCAVAFHIGGFIPVTLIGLAYAYRLGIGWREVEHAEDTVEDTLDRIDATGAEPAS